MRKPAQSTSRRWPFWLLIVAWVCANSPQAATYAVLTWIAEARQFSHQQQLTRDVAHLLVGERAPARDSVVVSSPEREQGSAAVPTVPAAAVLKKIDLENESRAEAARPGERVIAFAPTSEWWSGALRAPPPHDPPRAEIIS